MTHRLQVHQPVVTTLAALSVACFVTLDTALRWRATSRVVIP